MSDGPKRTTPPEVFLLPIFILALLFLMPTTVAFAQDEGTIDDGRPAIPTVDDIDDAQLLEAAPEQRLAELTLGLYQAVLDWESNVCTEMWTPVRRYLDEHESEIEAAAMAIAERAPNMTEEELAALIAFIETEISANPVTRAGQDKLYSCLRTAKGQGKKRPLEKQMRRFWRLQEPMVTAFTGVID